MSRPKALSARDTLASVLEDTGNRIAILQNNVGGLSG